ncbi:MAG: hypothetical protein VYE78_03815 [Candidatus Thermoplasmatota archaeon]|nr:hypothetical protein [Candidatus Thermoplasmatota archaeon]|tara:strand:+ start:4757 stop:4981 length:225 start_codon:yes stop_codon:yes gene_type:complete
MDAESIVKIILTISAILMIWTLLRYRQKNRLLQISENEDYSGMARDPRSLMVTDENAMEQFDKLLVNHGTDIDE